MSTLTILSPNLKNLNSISSKESLVFKRAIFSWSYLSHFRFNDPPRRGDVILSCHPCCPVIYHQSLPPSHFIEHRHLQSQTSILHHHLLFSTGFILSFFLPAPPFPAPFSFSLPKF